MIFRLKTIYLGNNLKAAGIFIGMVVGAGFFSIPYSIKQSGLLSGIINFTGVFIITLFLHMLYGYIAFCIPERHRFTGYVKIILGKKAEKIAFLNIIFSYYGTFLIYSILGGFFIYNLTLFYNPFFYSLIFLFLGGILFFFNFKAIGDINFYLTISLLISISIFSLFLVFKINFNNFAEINKFSFSNFFLPYGILLFSFSGFSAIPEVVDFFKKSGQFKEFKKTLKISQIIIGFFYAFFVFSVLGFLGDKTNENILNNTDKGSGLLSFIGILAVFTSFMVLILDFKNVLLLDYKTSLFFSWVAFFIPTLILLFFLKDSLLKIISITGSVGLGVFGFFILLMFEKIKVNIREITNYFWFMRIAAGLLILGAVSNIYIDFF